MVQHLPSMCRALGFIPSKTKQARPEKYQGPLKYRNTLLSVGTELHPFVVFFKKIHTETSRNEYKSRKIQLADAKKEETFTTHACPAQQCTAVMAPLGQKLAVNFKVDDVAFADKSVL